MSDDKLNRGPHDRERINVHEAYEVKYWTNTLGVTKEQLVQAVTQAGPMVKDVKAVLGRSA